MSICKQEELDSHFKRKKLEADIVKKARRWAKPHWRTGGGVTSAEASVIEAVEKLERFLKKESKP